METPQAAPAPVAKAQVAPAETFSALEADEAKEFWSRQDFQCYKPPQPWFEAMAARILEFRPRSVFEFGCNVGKNLLAIKQQQPEVFVAGVDIHRGAIEFGRDERGLPLFCADEAILPLLPDGAYDVVFTVSVLDHVPAPGPILAQLARVSRLALILLEPDTGEHGKVVRNVNTRSGAWVDTTPYSYSWEYIALTREYLPGWNVERRDFPLPHNLGRFYKCYTLTRGSPPP